MQRQNRWAVLCFLGMAISGCSGDDATDLPPDTNTDAAGGADTAPSTDGTSHEAAMDAKSQDVRVIESSTPDATADVVMDVVMDVTAELPPVCSQTLCNGSCVDIQGDPAHCGSCTTPCSANEFCSRGACRPNCPSALVGCARSCVDPLTSRDHCGATTGCGDEAGSPGVACAAGEVCNAGHCQLSCQTGLVNCGGVCVNPTVNPVHCGATAGCGVEAGSPGTACGSGQVCSSGTCQLSCQATLVNCAGLCVNPRTDNQHCGATVGCGEEAGIAGVECPSGQVCSSGQCQVSCQSGLVDCNGTCVDPLNDNNHCGATSGCLGNNAGVACAAGEVCTRGDCVLTCQAGLLDCGGTCINPNTDPAHCGASADCRGNQAGSACAAGRVCTNGSCALSCQAGLVNCDGSCVNPSTDGQHCGASADCQAANAGVICPAGQVCNAGTCQLSCQAGLVNCLGTCVNPTTDPNHCGASGDCTAANGGVVCSTGQVCSSGLCSLTCQTGLLNCDGKCVDPATDNEHCGAGTGCEGATAGVACAPGQICNAGVCSLSCQTGLVNCGGTCVNPLSDLQHCGASGDCTAAASGVSCAPGQVCNDGLCQLSCQSGLLNCGGTCINPTSDRDHCGASGNCTGVNAGVACPAGQVCNDGTCGLSCQAGLVNCGGICVNPTNDPGYCGATGDCLNANAGMVCPSGQVCSGGACSLSCQSGLLNCNGTCIDPQADRTHCGAIGNCAGSNSGTSCGAGQVCNAGSCQVSCQSGLVNCGGTCTNPNTDLNHCGALGDCNGPNAGTVCGAGRVCIDGGCQLSCQTGLVNCASTCIDPLTDRGYCGASDDCLAANAGTACPAGQVCNAGMCQLSCQTGLVNCGGTCVDPRIDRDHCGASGACGSGQAGAVCNAGEVCSNGTCSVSCPTGQVNCAGICVIPSTDRSHCGATADCQASNSGTVCAAGEVCTGGVCQVSCPVGQINCGGQCIEPTRDRGHCGATGDCQAANTGTACAAGQVCSLGTCQASCQAGLSNCSGTCTSLATDPQNCAACGTVCAGRTNAAAACAGSNCGFVCNSGFGDCDASRTNGCETNLLTSTSNCGSCGNACNVNETCVQGVCVGPPAPCTTGTDPGTGSPWVVCAADASTAWVSANNRGTFHALLICNSLGYATLSQWGGTCGNVCGFCQGATSCSSPGSRTFSQGTNVSPNCGTDGLGGKFCSTVTWECSH